MKLNSLFNKTKTKQAIAKTATVGAAATAKHSLKAQEPMLKSYSLGELLSDKSETPGDLIAPRILVPGETIVLGGAYGVGKTDLLLNWLAHLAAGKSFLGMTPIRPLKIFYWQAGSEYPYFKERVQSTQFDPEWRNLVGKNLVITAYTEKCLNKEGVDIMRRTILSSFPDDKVDIIAIDSLDLIFDGTYADMSSWARMREFERDRLEILREAVNPDCGIILVNDIQSPTKLQMEEDAFYEFEEVCNLSSTDISMLYVDANSSRRMLTFKLNLGAPIKPKLIDKVNGKWCEVTSSSTAIAQRKKTVA